MTDTSDQYALLQIGIILGQNDPDLDMKQFEGMPDFTNYINEKYDIDLTIGMYLTDVLEKMENET